jgi:hypothetical protein
MLITTVVAAFALVFVVIAAGLLPGDAFQEPNFCFGRSFCLKKYRQSGYRVACDSCMLLINLRLTMYLKRLRKRCRRSLGPQREAAKKEAVLSVKMVLYSWLTA